MKMPRRRGSRPPANSDTGPRHVDDGVASWRRRRRRMVTHIERPDSLLPSASPSGSRAIDTNDDVNAVLAGVARLGQAGALDEFTADTLDGVVEAWRAGWDARAAEELPRRVQTALHLGAQEAENLAAVTQAVARGREEVSDLKWKLACWEGVLLGEVTTLPFPAKQGWQASLTNLSSASVEPLVVTTSAGTLADTGRTALNAMSENHSPLAPAPPNEDPSTTPPIDSSTDTADTDAHVPLVTTTRPPLEMIQ